MAVRNFNLKRAPKPSKVVPACVNKFVSPVASKTNSVKFDPGRNKPFSGRLNGVAFASFDCGQAGAVDVGRREQSYTVQAIGIQVNSIDVSLAAHSVFMTLKNKTLAIVVVEVRSVLVVQQQVRVVPPFGYT